MFLALTFLSLELITTAALVQQSTMPNRACSILSRIQELDATRHASSYLGFVVHSQCVGQVHRDLVELLLEHSSSLFERRNGALHLSCKMNDKDEMTVAMETATQVLIDHKIIPKRHRDVYPLSIPGSHNKPIGGVMNRNAAPYFGITSVGVHLLCYEKEHAQQQNDVSLWMAQRSPNKTHFPSLWDPTVAGGQPAHSSLWDNLVKEAGEEAGIRPDQLHRQAKSVSCLSQMTSKPDGTCLKQSLYYCWELQVGTNNGNMPFEPRAVDGEVAQFELWNSATLLKEVQSKSSRLRPAMRLVVTDFLIRHGIITPDTTDEYAAIQSALHRERLVLWDEPPPDAA